MAKSRTIQLIISAKNRTAKVLKSIAGGMKKWGGGLLKITGGVTAGIAGITAALGFLYKKLATQIDEQAKMASQLGLSNQILGVFRDAAGYAGISVTNLNTALRKMSQSVADAANGTGEAKDALEELGLNAEQLRQQGPEKAFKAIIDRLDQIPAGIKKTGLAMDIFGRSGAAMANLTSRGLQGAQKDADTLKLKLTTAQAANVEAANDAWAKIKNAGGDFLKYITATLAPKVQEGFEKAFSFLKRQDLQKWAENAGKSILSLAKMIAETLPKVLLVSLEIVGKIAMGIRGWAMLWQESKIHALSFAATVQGILKFMAEGFRQIFTWINFKGMFDGAIEGLQDFVDRQNQIINQLEKDRTATISQQIETISDYEKEQQVIDDYKKTIGELEDAFKKIGEEEISSAKTTVSAEQTKIQAISSTTAAVNNQLAAIRKLKAEQGTIGTGSFQVTSYSGIENLDRQLSDEADR